MSDLFTLDIGATSMKWFDATGRRHQRRTPRPLAPEHFVRAVSGFCPPTATRVVVGFPGLVDRGFIRSALHLPESRDAREHAEVRAQWEDFDAAGALTQSLGRPVVVLNDAELAGFYLVEGVGRELVVTFGTSCAVALFDEGQPQWVGDVGGRRRTDGRSVDETVGAAAKRRNLDRWRADARAVLEELGQFFTPRVLWLSGGNTDEQFTSATVVVRPGPSALRGGERAWAHYRGA